MKKIVLRKKRLVSKRKLASKSTKKVTFVDANPHRVQHFLAEALERFPNTLKELAKR